MKFEALSSRAARGESDHKLMSIVGAHLRNHQQGHGFKPDSNTFRNNVLAELIGRTGVKNLSAAAFRRWNQIIARAVAQAEKEKGADQVNSKVNSLVKEAEKLQQEERARSGVEDLEEYHQQ